MNTTAFDDVPETNHDVMFYIRQFITFFGAYFMIVVIVFGLVTNLLSIFIFYRRREKDKVSAQFLGPLACVDFLNLAVCSLPTWLYDNLETISRGALKMDRIFGIDSHLGCKIYLSFWVALGFMSSWIIVCFSAERALVIWFPLRMQATVRSSKPRKIAILSVLVASLLTFLVIFPRSEIRSLEPDAPHRRQCAWRRNIPAVERILHSMMFTAVATGIPCVLIAILNILLLIALKSNKMESKSSDAVESRAELKMVKNLMLVCFFFILYTVPYIVLWAIYLHADITDFVGYTTDQAGDLGRLAYFSSSFIGMNYGCNGLVYVVSLDYYREDCKRILTCGLIGERMKGRRNLASSGRHVS